MTTSVFPQPAPDLQAAFKKCSTIASSNGILNILASDNEQNIYYTDNEFSVISIDRTERRETWRTQTGGRILPVTHIDGGSIYFFTYFEDNEKEKTISINSMSLKTGLINWQRKITEFRQTENLRIRNKTTDSEVLYVSGENKLMAIEKETGKSLWSKSFSAPVQAVEDSKNQKLSVLSGELIYILSGKTGEETQINSYRKPAENLLNSGNEIILGYRTGEIIKTSLQDKQSEPIWKLKTGASVTGIYEYENKILVTSLDNFIYMISKESGNLKWKRRVGGRILIRPLIQKKHAVFLTSGDNLATIIDLEEGKAVNQIRIEENNYFSGEPYISGDFLVLQTFRGIYYFINTNKNCA